MGRAGKLGYRVNENTAMSYLGILAFLILRGRTRRGLAARRGLASGEIRGRPRWAKRASADHGALGGTLGKVVVAGNGRMCSGSCCAILEGVHAPGRGAERPRQRQNLQEDEM